LIVTRVLAVARVIVLAGLGLVLIPTVAVAADGAAPVDGPLRVRNLSPAAHLYGLPRALGAVLPVQERELAVTLEHVNNFTAGSGEGVVAFFDGTTTITSLSLRQSAGAGLEWGLEVPWVWHSGGFTDRFIDGFHDLFGFPDGGRDSAPRNRLDYRIDVAGSEPVRVREAGGHPGDVRGWVGYEVLRSTARRAALRGSVKLPTGRVRHLSGSEAADVSLAVELVDEVLLASLGVTTTVMVAVTRLGAGDLASAAQRDWVASGHLGFTAPVWGRLSLHGQLDAHSDVVDTGIPQVSGRAVQGTLGGRLALPRAFSLDLAITEDLTGKSAPDVVFHAMLARRF
jgi:hypothetical protein